MRTECSQQVLDLYHQLQDEGIELVRHFIPSGGWWFDAGETRYYVTETDDSLTLKWTKELTRDGLTPSEVVQIATRRAAF